MDIQDKHRLLTNGEKKFYLFGASIFAGLFLSTIILGQLLSPLLLLKLRLSLVGIGLLYYLAAYFFFLRLFLKKSKRNEVKNSEIIIYFNGKELGKR